MKRKHQKANETCAKCGTKRKDFWHQKKNSTRHIFVKKGG